MEVFNFNICCFITIFKWGEGNLRPRRPPREYLGEYTSWGKPKIPLGMHRIAICIILQEPEPDIWILVAQQLIFVFTVCYE